MQAAAGCQHGGGSATVAAGRRQQGCRVSRLTRSGPPAQTCTRRWRPRAGSRAPASRERQQGAGHADCGCGHAFRHRAWGGFQRAACKPAAALAGTQGRPHRLTTPRPRRARQHPAAASARPAPTSQTSPSCQVMTRPRPSSQAPSASWLPTTSSCSPNATLAQGRRAAGAGAPASANARRVREWRGQCSACGLHPPGPIFKRACIVERACGTGSAAGGGWRAGGAAEFSLALQLERHLQGGGAALGGVGLLPHEADGQGPRASEGGPAPLGQRSAAGHRSPAQRRHAEHRDRGAAPGRRGRLFKRVGSEPWAACSSCGGASARQAAIVIRGNCGRSREGGLRPAGLTRACVAEAATLGLRLTARGLGLCTQMWSTPLVGV